MLTLLVMQGTTLVDYTPYLSYLQVHTVAPGGFGTLRAKLVLPSARARIARPEFGVLNGRLVLMDGLRCIWSGEITQAVLTLDHLGEGIELLGQGGAGAISDDPQDSAYVSQTAQAIVAAEMTRRAAYLAIDADTSAVLPAAPVATFSPVFDGMALSDVLHELSDLLGDYVWGVWDHPTHKDGYGLPTWQLQMHPRDTATVGWSALGADVASWRIASASERMFNGVTLHYLDPAVGPGTVTVTDARLNGDLSQGSAPFRFRRFRRDMGRRMLTAAQATTLANQYLGVFENLSNIISVNLTRLRNAQGQVVPLFWCRADANIELAELLPRAASFAALPGLVAGGNLFYIRETIYTMQAKRAPVLTVLLDQVADYAAADLTRMRYAEQLRQKSLRNGVGVMPVGLPVRGYTGTGMVATAAAQVISVSVNFPAQLSKVPTSIGVYTLTSTNFSGPVTATNITVFGCRLSWKSAAAGYSEWYGYYQTVGN